MNTPNRRHLNIALIVGVMVFVCVSLAHVPGLALGLGYLAPAVFVFVLLWLGCYPGERLLVALSQRTERRHGTPFIVARRALGRMPRGGSLLAWALAGRAPPLSLG
jgi:hypothetical protein